MAIYNVGETVICSIEVTDDSGALKDPATSMNIAIDCQKPFSNVVSSTAMVKDSTGKYHYDYNSSGATPGNYKAIYTATDGTRITIETDGFTLE